MKLNTHAMLGIAVALAAVEPAVVRAQVTPTFNDVVYATVPRDAGGTINVLLDIYLPATGGPWPLVLWIHGGGWQGGTHNTAPGSTQLLLNAGIAVASTSYRLSGDAIFPAQIHDVKGAVRYLRANAATYNLDPNRFACWGSSAGGHLSALLATSGGVAALEGTSGGNLAFSSRVQAAADYFGPTDILHMNEDITTPPGGFDHDAPNSPESNLVGWDDPGQGLADIKANLTNPNPPYPALVALCNQVNPITWLSVDDPPMFIGHGSNDTAVPTKQSTRLADAMFALSLFHDYRIIPAAGHGFLGTDTEISARSFFIAQFNSPVLTGDADCNGVVNLNDVTAFAQRLVNPAAFDAAHLGCNTINCDINHDGRTDGNDIRAMVDLVIP